MKHFIYLKIFFIFFTLSSFVFPGKAYAYLDPGTGSYFLQLIIAALLGGLFAIKLFWGKIKIFLKNLFVRKVKPGKNKGQ